MKKKPILLYLFFALLISINSTSIEAAIAMKIPFSSHMVLQRNARVNIWGTGASGETVTVKFNGQTKITTTGSDKNWKLQLEPMLAAGPLTMTVSGSNTITFTDIYIGEVWQCGGQSNMDLTLSAADWKGAFDTEIANANYPRMRYMKTRKGNNTWNVISPSTAGGCSATGYFFGKDLLQNLDCAVGLLVTAVGGTTIDQWFDPVTLNAFKGKLDGGVTPGDMFDQFVKPVIPYTIKGTVWIQGEQNASKGFGAVDYGDRFKAVITNWRKAWGQGDYPFYFGQITGINTTQATPFPNSSAALVREGQRDALQLPQTAMSVMLDISAGGWHYTNKKEAGRRLALAPKALLYGKSMEYSGPLFESFSVSGNSVTINFNHGKGLKTNDGKSPSGFAVAGANGVWYIADKMTISGTSVIVSSASVSKPVRVCMGWNDRPRVNLYNGDGLQATPFLSDVVSPCAVLTPSVMVTGSLTFCEGESASLTSGTASSYIWKNGTSQVGTSQTYVAKTSGSYTVEVINANGCKGTSAETVITVIIPSAWYADIDADGKGDINDSKTSCTQPAGYVSDKSDLCPLDKAKSEPGNCGCGKTETICLDCANIPHGAAVLDVCGKCVGGSTGLEPCNVITGIHSANTSEKMLVSPQPFESKLTIRFKDESQIKSIVVTNLLGEIVYESDNAASSEISFGETLSSGIYIINAEHNKGFYTAKVIKVK